MENNALFSKKSLCCGCEACTNICPAHIITMSSDIEGFYYPLIIDTNKCISCYSCIEVCPIKHVDEIQSSFSKAYAGHSSEETITVNSASGGFATVLSKKFINQFDGVVYGVSYSGDFHSVLYSRTTNFDGLLNFQTSKYSQARKHDVYQMVKDDLKSNKVLFIGTPCDAYALVRYLKNHDNLYIVTLICHGPTSEKVHTMFCDELERKHQSKISSFSLRYKKDGVWKPYYIRALFSDGSEYLERFEDTMYNTAFLYFKRPSCTTCRFKNNHFAGDILIGDYHSANPWTKEYYIHGVSSMLPLTNKGFELLNMTRNDFVLSEVSLESSIGQQAIHTPVNKRINRVKYSDKLNTKGLENACSIPSIRFDQNITRIKRKIRGFLGRLKRRILSFS